MSPLLFSRSLGLLQRKFEVCQVRSACTVASRLSNVLTSHHPVLPYLLSFEAQVQSGARVNTPFLQYFPSSATVPRLGPSKALNKAQVLAAAVRVAARLREEFKLKRGDCVISAVSCNNYEEVVFRLAASFLGVVPATINWQADSPSKALYKISATNAKLIVTDAAWRDEQHTFNTTYRGLSSSVDLPSVDVGQFGVENEAVQPEFTALLSDLLDVIDRNVSADDVKLICFTSGTTGHPKGVKLSFKNYAATAASFNDLLSIAPSQPFCVAAVNPFHHTNTSALTDWVLRSASPSSCLVLFQRYWRGFWPQLLEVCSVRAQDSTSRTVVPLVASHVDFLQQQIDSESRLSEESFLNSMQNVDLLMGSAPVGPTTVQRVLRLFGKYPVVRYGATETTLQVLGTPNHSTNKEALAAAFEAGQHPLITGYYIGRPHCNTRAEVVQSLDRASPNFLCPQRCGYAGDIVCQGDNIMNGYVNVEPSHEQSLFHPDSETGGTWYLGLGDRGFKLVNTVDGKEDFYWVSRSSALLIKGGANYSYEQINDELATLISRYFHLQRASDFDVAVIGLRVTSEHDDDTACLIELLSEQAKQIKHQLEAQLCDIVLSAYHQRQVSKGALIAYLKFGKIPRNFKGAVLVPELKMLWQEKGDHRTF